MNRVRESNTLQIWGNKDSMNLNSMILTNIQSSTYFKQKLFELKTYHEIIDEIYYRVNHLEPWEKGSRRTQGLTGMCGGVRGVGGGGIVSTAFCLLYKLYTLKLTRKQVVGLITHTDSPYIRSLGFMYVRYTQDPKDLLHWYYDYLDDEEEVDVRAGGGQLITIGHMLRQWLTKLEWFDTLFPRIPVPIQTEIFNALQSKYGSRMDTAGFYEGSKSSGRDSSSRSASKRTPPPEIAEIAKKSRSSRSGSRDRSTSRGRSRRSRSKSQRRKSDEKSGRTKKDRRSRSRSRSKRSSSIRSRSRSHSDSDRDRKHRHRKHGSPKRSDKEEERRKHRHHRKHSSRHREELKSKKESKKNVTDSDSS